MRLELTPDEACELYDYLALRPGEWTENMERVFEKVQKLDDKVHQ